MNASQAKKITRDGVTVNIIAHSWGNSTMPECVTLDEEIALGIEFPEPEAPKPERSKIVPVSTLAALGWEFA